MTAPRYQIARTNNHPIGWSVIENNPAAPSIVVIAQQCAFEDAEAIAEALNAATAPAAQSAAPVAPSEEEFDRLLVAFGRRCWERGAHGEPQLPDVWRQAVLDLFRRARGGAS